MYMTRTQEGLLCVCQGLMLAGRLPRLALSLPTAVQLFLYQMHMYQYRLARARPF